MKEALSLDTAEKLDVFDVFGKRSDGLLDIAKTVVSDLETKVPEVIDKASSAAGAVATEAGAIATEAVAIASEIPSVLEKFVPDNVSVGLSQFCIATKEDLSCHDLPLKPSDVFPDELGLTKGLDKLPAFQSFQRLTTMVFRDLWIGGFVFSIIIIFWSVLPTLGWLLHQRRLRVIFHALLALACFGLCLAPVVVMHVVKDKARQLPEWLSVTYGEVPKMYSAGVCVAGVMAALGGFFHWAVSTDLLTISGPYK